MIPKVSIIIPAYNVEKYIAECLGSVLAQTFVDWEAIVIDDGSTDGTVLEIKKFDDERIGLLQQRNAGLSVSRNRGIALAKGNFVLCLDSDDRLHPETLQVCYNLAQKYVLDAVTFDGFDFRVEEGGEIIMKGGYFDRSRKLEERKYRGQEFLEKEVFAKAVVVSAPLYFVKREKLLQVPFEKDMLHEDVLFHYTLLLFLQNIYYLPQKFYQRRLREHSIVHTNPSLKSLESYVKIIHSLESRYVAAELNRKRLYRKIIAKNMLQVGKLGKRYLLGRGENKAIAWQLLKQITFKGSLILCKSIYFFLGFTYYLFSDVFKTKNL